MEETDSSPRTQPTSTPSKSFLKRFNLRDVQTTLGNLKRSVAQRTARRNIPVAETPSEHTEDEPQQIPPYKELYVQKQTAETVLKELHDGYFEDTFDPVEFELQTVDNDVGQEEVDAKVEHLTSALEVVSLQLSEKVMEKHDHFVEGISTVGSIESDLQQAHVSTVNARLRVKLALEEVKRSAAIAQQTRQKQRYMEVLRLLSSIKQTAQLKHSLREALEDGDYIQAMMTSDECMDELDSLGNIRIALDLKQSVDLLMRETTDRIDAALNAICTDFRPDAYRNILQCFVFQNTTVSDLSSRILQAFQNSITKASSRVVRSLIVTKPGLADAMFSPKYDPSFSEMCSGLPYDLLRPCLAKLLEVLFDILSSYHGMSSWHEATLRHAQTELEKVQEQLSDNRETDADDEGDKAVEEAQRTVDVLGAVHEILVQSRKVIWDSVARRVRDLLSGPAAVEGEHFLQVMEWCQKFLRSGEAFINDRSDLLRSIITIQCGNFFQSYHGTNLDAFEMMLRSEQFVNITLPETKLRENGRLGTMLSAVLEREEGDGFYIYAEFNTTDFDAWIARGNPFRANDESNKKHVDQLRSESDIILGFGGASNMDDGLAAQRLEVDARGHANKNNIWSSESISSTAQSVTKQETEPNDDDDNDDDDEEEDPELFGQDIDEETQTVRMDDATNTLTPESTGTVFTLSTNQPDSSDIALGRCVLILTNSAHQILKWLKNYCALMKPLSSRSEDIFSGMCDLFDGYFLDVFLFVGGISLSQLVWEEDLITTRLRSTLLRILKTVNHKYKEEIERIEATKPPVRSISDPQAKFSLESLANRFNAIKTTNLNMNGSQPGIFGTGGSPRVSTLSEHRASLLTAENMYGLRETVVAVGSVELLAKELSNAKNKIQSLLPATATRSLDNYFSRTIDATDDLRECAFRNAARRILYAVFDTERGTAVQIAATSYDSEEPPESHSPWAHSLGEHIQRFSELINHAQLPSDMVIQMWEHAMKACSEVILDGLALVKRCTMPGRSKMSLDLSYVESNFKFMVPTDVHVNLRIVDAYIKAYYLPWEDVPKWVEVNHAEYGRSRVLALFHLIVDRVSSVEKRILKKAEIKAAQSRLETCMHQI